MEEKKLICIGCPLGCEVTVVREGERIVRITGHTCKRGEDYARKEVTNPTRIVTSTVRVMGGSTGIVSVKTREDIPKEKVFACMKELKDIVVEAPIHQGDVIVSDIAGTGIDVVATKAVE